jgi:hypothetical protein
MIRVDVERQILNENQLPSKEEKLKLRREYSPPTSCSSPFESTRGGVPAFSDDGYYGS